MGVTLFLRQRIDIQKFMGKICRLVPRFAGRTRNSGYDVRYQHEISSEKSRDIFSCVWLCGEHHS